MKEKTVKKVLFLRKKISGENSIEELAYILISKIPDLELVIFPETGNSFSKIVKNISKFLYAILPRYFFS